MQPDLGLKLDIFLLHYVRVIRISCALLYPFSGHVLLLIDDGYTEILSHRYLIGLSFILVFLSTYFSDRFKRNSIYLLYLSLTVGILWLVYIVGINNFNLNYTILLVVAISATSTIILSRRIILLFLISVSAVLFITVSQNTLVDVNPYTAVFGCFVLGTVLIINNNYKNKIKNEAYALNKQLGRYNQNLEEEVEKRTQLLKLKNAELENYTYLVSHDLKSPLTNVGSFAKLLDKEIKNKNYDELSHHTKIINQSVNRMSSILNDLLLHGKVGLTESNYETIDLKELIALLIATNFSAQIENGASVVLGEQVPQVIVGDRKQISLLLQNLISNGLKYNNSNNKIVQISGSSSGGKTTISVSDNGIGFIARDSDRIFEMFRRLHTKDDYEGTGIGLAICKRIVENHNGYIKASSVKGGGSNFEFSLAV